MKKKVFTEVEEEPASIPPFTGEYSSSPASISEEELYSPVNGGIYVTGYSDVISLRYKLKRQDLAVIKQWFLQTK